MCSAMNKNTRNRASSCINCRVAGFTLLELVAVILILSVTIVGSASFLRWGVLAFVDGADRQNFLEENRFIIERLSREIRNAVPASIRINANGSCIEFVPIVGSGSYLSLPTTSSDTVVEVVADNAYTFTVGDDFIIQADNANDIYASSNNNRISIQGYSVAAAAAGTNLAQATITIPATQFDAAYQANPSRPNRYYIVNNQVSFCVLSNGSMHRYQYTTLYNSQPNTTTFSSDNINGELMVENIDNVSGGNFTYADSNQTSVSLYLLFSREDAEPMQFYHQVRLKNAR